MTERMGLLALAAAALSLTGCGWLPDAYTGCEDLKPYQSAKEEAPLKVPAGADLPDTRNALKIPASTGPDVPLEAGTCLEHPPAIGTTAVASANGTAPPAAAAAEAPAAGRAPALAMDDGRPWQTRLGANYQLTTDTDFDGGSTVEFNSSVGFLVGLGYELSPHFEVGANFTYDDRDYEGSLAGDEPGEFFPIQGSLQSMGVMIDLNYYFTTGRFTPFITTGIGWNFIDTKIPTAPPQVGCWWDPWYGYVCQGFQETKDANGFAYQAGAGFRYRVNPSVSLNGSYRVNWLDFPKADGTPDFGQFQFTVDWGF